MSIRLRLALSYGTLFALILPLVTVLSYALHARGQYDDLDRALLVSAGHAIAEASDSVTGPHLIQGKEGLEIALRFYTTTGTLQELSLGTETLPTMNPYNVLRNPSGPAFDAFTSLIPPMMGYVSVPPRGVFYLLSTPTQRWRVYVQPIYFGVRTTGYIEALTPLGHIDTSMQTFRLLLGVLGFCSLIAALGGSWAIAGNALRPIARMIQTAQTIALSRDLSQRIDMPAQKDELGRLAATFNEMLASIEGAYRTQQRFVSDASHELRAPLTAIQGNLELLRRYQAMPAGEREEAFEEMEREADRLSRLVADMLALARADAGVPLKRHTIDLDVIVLDSFRSARQLAHGQTMQLEPFEPAQTDGDEDRLKQLLLILLDNALKYTPEQGHIMLGLHHKDGHIEIVVHDTGMGIAPEDLPHVFERFYRADPGRSRDPGGTGLGLPIAQWIVEQHGGAISLKSQQEQGTCVTVSLPLSGGRL